MLQQQEINTVSAAITEYGQDLRKMNFDYAAWDNMYDYVKSQKTEFIDDNFDTAFFLREKLNVLMVTDSLGNIIAEKGIEDDTSSLLNLNKLSINGSFKYMQIMQARPYSVQSYSGIISTDIGNFIFAISSIKSDSSDFLPANGFLIFMRRLDNTFISQLSKKLQIKLSVEPYTINDTDIPELAVNTPIEHFKETKFRLLVDEFDTPFFVLKISNTQTYRTQLITPALLFTIGIQFLLLICTKVILKIKMERPIGKVIKSINLMTENKTISQLHTSNHITEFRQLIGQFNALVETINVQQKQLSELSKTDPLTQLPNRLAFQQHYASEWAHLQRNQTHFAILMCDIDYFKKYNDALGHLAGDDALIKVAQALKSCTKRTNDIVARFGGEEFIILFSSISYIGLEQKIKDLLSSIEALKIPHPNSDISDYISLSIGATIVSPIQSTSQEMDLSKATKVADDALYQAKENGRNQGKVLQFEQENQTDVIYAD